MATATASPMYRTETLRSAPMAGVDREKGVIYGAKLIELGQVNDHRPFVMDETTLEQVVELGSASNRGLKARFAHPNMSNDGMGKHLGRWTNLRIENGAVYGDLVFAQSAYDTPYGDLAGYVMDLAADDPEAFGISIATTPDDAAMQEGTEEGAELMPFRITKLHAADVVDEPAATRGGLFDIASPQGLPAAVTWLMDKHFAESTPEEVFERFTSFMERYFGEVFTVSFGTEVPETTTTVTVDSNSGPIEVTIPHSETADLSEIEQPHFSKSDAFIEHFGDRGARWFLEGKTYQECLGIVNSELTEQNTTLQQKVDSLQSQLQQVTQLGMGEVEPLSVSVEMSPEEQRKAERMVEIEKRRKQGLSLSQAKFAAAFEDMKPDLKKP